jgi:hypothetical protein
MMASLLEPERTASRATPGPSRPAAVREWRLLLSGALIALFGVYTGYAPEHWVAAGLGVGWRLGSFAVGGLLLSGGFSAFADRILEFDSNRTWLVVTDTVLAVGTLAAAVVFTAVLIL